MATMRKTLTIILIISLVSLCACAPKAIFYNPLELTVKMRAGEPYTPPVDGWYLSNTRLEQLMLSVEKYRGLWEECERDK